MEEKVNAKRSAKMYNGKMKYKDMKYGDSMVDKVKKTQKHPIAEVKPVSIEDYKKKKVT